MQSTHYNNMKVVIGDTITLSGGKDAIVYDVVDIPDAFTLGIRQQGTGSTSRAFCRQEIDISFVVASSSSATIDAH